VLGSILATGRRARPVRIIGTVGVGCERSSSNCRRRWRIATRPCGVLPATATPSTASGLVYLKTKNAAAAIADYDAALQAHPKNASSLYGRGVAKGLNGDKAGGDADITAAKRIDPEIVKKYEGYGLRGS
jgi:hypothetical protein